MVATQQQHIVTPEEAETVLAVHPNDTSALLKRYARTVASEPDRIRAAVVAVLRDAQHEYERKADMADEITGRTLALFFADVFRKRADAIENGDDF